MDVVNRCRNKWRLKSGLFGFVLALIGFVLALIGFELGLFSNLTKCPLSRICLS